MMRHRDEKTHKKSSVFNQLFYAGAYLYSVNTIHLGSNPWRNDFFRGDTQACSKNKLIAIGMMVVNEIFFELVHVLNPIPYK